MESLLRDDKHRIEENVKRNYDSLHIYYSSGIFEYTMFTAYPDSPTANKYKKAFEIFHAAKDLLLNFTKTKVETEEDCECLQPAFHGYANARIVEKHLFGVFMPPAITTDLIDQYLTIRPNDILTEYLKTAIIFTEPPTSYKSKNGYSNIKHLKKLIRLNEEFASKVSKLIPQSDIHRDLLIHLYFLLGSLYSNTDQEVRALDSFQKSYDLDNSDLDSLYGVAFYNFYRKFEKAESLLQKYLQLAPECDRRYYDAYYTLALVNFRRNKFEQAQNYYYEGVAAEKKCLPWLPAWDTYSRKKARMNIKLLEGFNDRYLEGPK